MQAGLVFLFERRGGLKLCLFIRAALEALEHAPWVFRCALQSFENPVSHFHRRLEGCFLTAVLAVREVLGELIPLAADAQSPPLERGGLVGVAGNITLGHIVVAGLSTGCAYIATSGYF